jgi:predicted NBD/HSP70 family sugar kinase
VDVRVVLPRGTDPAGAWLAAMQAAREAMRRGFVEPAQVECAAVSVDATFAAGSALVRDSAVPGWRAFDVGRGLREHLGIDHAVAASRVLCEMRAEMAGGALRDCDASCLFLHLDNTVTGAMAHRDTVAGCDRAQLLGIGSICIERGGALGSNGRHGTMDAYCGRDAFLMGARSYGLNAASPLEVWNAAGANFAAQSLCDDFIDRLAQGLGAAIVLLNPRRVVCGGRLTRELGEQLLRPLRTRLPYYCAPRQCDGLEVNASQVGADSALVGAMALAVAYASAWAQAATA